MVHRRALGGCVALVACSILIGCAREPVPVATPRDLTEQRLLTPDPTILVPNLAEIARLQPASAASSPAEITPPQEQSATEAERYRLRPGDLVEVLYRFPAAATAEPYRIGVGDQVRVLGPGDAYYFDSRTPHRFRNVGAEECEVVTANSPPSF